MNKSAKKVPAATAKRQAGRSLLNCRVSCYRGVDPKNRAGDRPLAEVLEAIQTRPVPEQARIRELKRHLRQLKPETPEYKQFKKRHEALKKRLFGFTPSGICRNGRTDDGLTSYNGIVLADFDELENEAEREKLVDLVRSDHHVLAVWRSVSGFGVKALVAGRREKQFHEANFAAVAAYMRKLTGHEIDPRCKNVARFCFAGHDPEIRINEHAEQIAPLAQPKEREKPEPAPLSADRLTHFRQQIEKDGRVGKVKWTTLNGKPVGLCHCPDPVRKHPKATIHLTGVPNLYCHHEKCKPQYVAEYNDWLQTEWNRLKGWVHIVETKSFINCETFIELDKEAFNNRCADEFMKLPSLVVLRDPKFPKYDHQTYRPDKPATFEEKGRTYFNTYRPETDVVPVEADVKPFLDHTAYLIPDETERDIFLDWLALQVQCPGRKILWAMLVQGGQGIGKSYFREVMSVLLGEHNVSCPSNSAVHEEWTAWAKRCQLVVIDEFMTRRQLKMELVNKLQPMITEPYVSIREMYRVPYNQPNRFNLLMFTNYMDALPLDDDDRRYCIIYSKAAKKKEAYYRKLWDWTRAHYGELLYYFQHRKIQIHPLSRAPETQWKKQLIQYSSPLTDWIITNIEDHAWPFSCDIVGVRHLVGCLPACLKPNLQNVGRALKAAGAKPVGTSDSIPLTSGEFARCHSVRNHDLWADKSNAEIAQEYERWSMSQEPGGNPIKDSKPM